MFEDAIRYPWRGEKNVETILLGGILGLLGVLVIPTFLVLGYLVRVIRRVGDGQRMDPPVFEDWGDLLIDGIVVFAVALVYGLVPVLVVALALASFVVPVGLGADGGGVIVGAIVMLVALLLALVAALAVFYLLPAAVVAYVRSDDLRAAFSPRAVEAVARSREYPKAWLVAVVVAILGNLVAGALAITIVGVLLVPFVTFYANVAGAYAIGRALDAYEHGAGTIGGVGQSPRADTARGGP